MFRSLYLSLLLLLSFSITSVASASLELFELRVDSTNHAVIELKTGFTSANEIVQLVEARLDNVLIPITKQGERLWLSENPIEGGAHTLNLRLNVADKGQYQSVSAGIVNVNTDISIISQRLSSEQDPAIREQLIAERAQLYIERQDLMALQSGLKNLVVSENHIFELTVRGLNLVEIRNVACVTNINRDFATIITDSENYNLGERSLVTAGIDILPDNPNYEISVLAYFNNKAVVVNKLTDSEAVAFSPDLAEVGEFAWRVDLYLQDKNRALEYNEVILNLERSIDSTNRQIARERDQVLKDLLIQEKARLNQELQIVKRQLSDIRVKVDSQTASINVGEKGIDLKSFFASLLLKNSFNHENLHYVAGDTVEYSIQVISGFLGDDGEQELVVRGWLNGAKQKLVADGVYFYQGSSVIAEDASGEQAFISRLYLRSKVRSQSVRGGIAKAEVKLREYMHLRAGAYDTIMEQYYARKVTEMEKVIANYYRILEQMLDMVGYERNILTIEGTELPPITCSEEDVTAQFPDAGFRILIKEQTWHS